MSMGINAKLGLCVLLAMMMTGVQAESAPGDRGVGQHGPWSLDDGFAEVSNGVPGFGGAFYDEHDQLNVYMLDSSRQAEADLEAELNDQFGPGRGRGTGPGAGMRAVGSGPGGDRRHQHAHHRDRCGARL